MLVLIGYWLLNITGVNYRAKDLIDTCFTSSLQPLQAGY